MTVQQGQILTLAFILATTAIVIGYDVLAARAWGREATISYVMRRTFDRWPILYPVFWLWLGILAGHIGLPTER